MVRTHVGYPVSVDGNVAVKCLRAGTVVDDAIAHYEIVDHPVISCDSGQR